MECLGGREPTQLWCTHVTCGLRPPPTVADPCLQRGRRAHSTKPADLRVPAGAPSEPGQSAADGQTGEPGGHRFAESFVLPRSTWPTWFIAGAQPRPRWNPAPGWQRRPDQAAAGPLLALWSGRPATCAMVRRPSCVFRRLGRVFSCPNPGKPPPPKLPCRVDAPKRGAYQYETGCDFFSRPGFFHGMSNHREVGATASLPSSSFLACFLGDTPVPSLLRHPGDCAAAVGNPRGPPLHCPDTVAPPGGDVLAVTPRSSWWAVESSISPLLLRPGFPGHETGNDWSKHPPGRFRLALGGAGPSAGPTTSRLSKKPRPTNNQPGGRADLQFRWALARERRPVQAYIHPPVRQVANYFWCSLSHAVSTALTRNLSG